MSRSRVPPILSLLYNHNPFYLISAAMFVYGLKLFFRVGDSTVLFQRGSVAYMEPWGLVASLAGVTMLMAVTAFLVVRLGRVWEDARSLLMIVLLMLLAISVCMDELVILVSDQDESRRSLFTMFALGSGFAIGICEGLFVCLRIRLSIRYRLPLYGFLALFFLWPALLLPELTSFSAQATRWLVVAFPSVAALLTLSLISAVRSGSAAVANNGTPWRWPLFPWTPFVFIALAVVFRSYSLTMSYDAVKSSTHYWNTVFGVYQLVPFLLAVLVVLLEIGIAEDVPLLRRGVLFGAPLLLIVSCPGLAPWSALPAYAGFSDSLATQIGAPVFLTAIGLLLLYGWAWWKGIAAAGFGFSAMLYAATCLGPRAMIGPGWGLDITPWPLLLQAMLYVVAGIRRGRSWGVFTGVMLALIAANIFKGDWEFMREWRGFAAMHVILFAAIVIGVSFKDVFAEMLRELGPVLFAMTALVGLISLEKNTEATWASAAYLVSSMFVAMLLAAMLRSPAYMYLAVAQLCLGAVVALVVGGKIFLNAQLPAGVKHVTVGLVNFALAVFISVLKSGLARRMRMYWVTHRRVLRSGPSA